MPRKSKTRKVIAFGKSFVPLGNRSSPDANCPDSQCLACNDELIEILPTFALETIQRVSAGLRLIIHCCSTLEGLYEATKKNDDSENVRIALTQAIQQFERSIENLNFICDAILPWIVWNAKPEKRVTAETPIAIDHLIAVEQTAATLVRRLELEGSEVGGEFWRYAPGVKKLCKTRLDELIEEACDDDRLELVAVGLDKNHFQTLRLQRVDPPEIWNFCSEECCRSFESNSRQTETKDWKEVIPSLLVEASELLSKQRLETKLTADQHAFLTALVNRGGHDFPESIEKQMGKVWATPRRSCDRLVNGDKKTKGLNWRLSKLCVAFRLKITSGECLMVPESWLDHPKSS